MPELPEVQNMVNYIQKCKGQKIQSVYKSTFKLRFDNDRNFIEDVKQSKIEHIYRKAKYIVINLENNISLIIHAGMTGVISVFNYDYKPIKHDHVILYLSDNVLVFNDPRRFGMFISVCTNQINELKFFNSIGIDALSDDLTFTYLLEKIAKLKSPIKQILLNQKIIAGCGNIYANEALYMSHVNPFKQGKDISENEAKLLVKNLKIVLNQSIKEGGSTLKDYKKPDGSKGGFQDFFQVYGKNGHPCPTCKQNKVECHIIKTNISNRATYYCTNNQI